MKKLVVILTLTLSLAACDNKTDETTAGSKDSVSADSPLMDAVNTADSASKMMHDSTGKMPDTLMNK